MFSETEISNVKSYLFDLDGNVVWFGNGIENGIERGRVAVGDDLYSVVRLFLVDIEVKCVDCYVTYNDVLRVWLIDKLCYDCMNECRW